MNKVLTKIKEVSADLGKAHKNIFNKLILRNEVLAYGFHVIK